MLSGGHGRLRTEIDIGAGSRGWRGESMCGKGSCHQRFICWLGVRRRQSVYVECVGSMKCVRGLSAFDK